jgi:hypothetical protein
MPRLRDVITWLVASVVVLIGLSMIAATIGGNVGPLEVATACIVGVGVAVARARRRPTVDTDRTG